MTSPIRAALELRPAGIHLRALSDACDRARYIHHTVSALAYDTYPAPERAQTEAAIAAVLAMEPLPAGRAPHVPTAGSEPLPAGVPALLALCGLPRSGKDTAAEYLMGRYAHVVRLAFSTPILAEVNTFLAPHGHHLTEANKSDARYRRLLQVWGAGRRLEHPQWWTDRLAERIEAARADGARLVVLSGARDPGDFAFVRARGGAVWRIERPGHVAAAIDHPLERYVASLPADELDAEIVNPEGNVAAYQAAIERALRATRTH